MPSSTLPTQPRYWRSRAGGQVALLDGAGLVEDADGADGIGREFGDGVAEAARDGVGESAVVPEAGLEELLEVAGRLAGEQGDRLGGLARQVGEQAARVVAEVADGGAGVEEALEGAQEGGQYGGERLDLVDGHGNSLPRAGGYYTCGETNVRCAVVLGSQW